jgi:integrase
MRLGEVLALRWGRVNLDTKLVQVREAIEETRALGVRFKTPKSKAGTRDISLPDLAADTLRNHRKQQLELRLQLGLGRLSDDDLVFPNIKGEPQAPNTISAEWSDLAERIGSPEITFHALRHTHASQLIKAGVDIVTVSKRLGHSKPVITLRIYAHVFNDSDSKAVDAINAALGS